MKQVIASLIIFGLVGDGFGSSKAFCDPPISTAIPGPVQLGSEHVDQEIEHSRDLLKFRQALAASDLNNEQAQRDLSLALKKLGNVLLYAGHRTEALGSYRNAFEIDQKLAAAEPDNARAQRELANSYDKLGNVHAQCGDVTEALESYQNAFDIFQKLLAVEPSDTRAQRDLAISHEMLGNVLLQSGQFSEALKHCQSRMEISLAIASAMPSNYSAQRELSVAYQNLGNVQSKFRQETEALSTYDQMREINQKLVTDYPDDAWAQFALFVSHQKIALQLAKLKEYDKGAESYRRGLTLLRGLKAQKRLAPADEKWIAVAEEVIQKYEHAPIALGDWNLLLEQPTELLPGMLDLRGTQFVHEGRYAEAVQAVAKLRELKPTTGWPLYNAACVYSLSAAAIKTDNGEPAGDPIAMRQHHIDDALATLREAFSAGWNDIGHIQQDPDLNVLRELPEFQQLIQVLKDRAKAEVPAPKPAKESR